MAIFIIAVAAILVISALMTLTGRGGGFHVHECSAIVSALSETDTVYGPLF